MKLPANDDTQARSGNESRVAPLLLLAGMCFYVLRATDWFRAVPGDLGDARFNSVILEHLHQWVRGDAASLWTPSFFYPARGTLTFSDNHFGSGLIYVIFRFMGLGREHAFDAWFVVGHVLNFVAMHIVMRRLQFTSFAASVAAFIYAFAMPALAQEGHAQLTYRFALPLAYLAFLQFAQERRVQQLARLAAWGALQFFCSIYLGVFMVYLMAATALAMLLPGLRPAWAGSAHEPATRTVRPTPIIVILACAAATACLLIKYQAVSRSYGFSRGAADIMVMLPRLQSYLLADGAPAYRWLGNAVPEVPFRHEHQMFLGFVPILLVLGALATARSANASRRRLMGQSLAALAVLVTLTLSVGDRSIYQFAMALPGISSIRAVSRIILVMTVPVAILAAIGVENLQRIRGARWLVAGAIVLGLSLETLAFRPGATPIGHWHNRMTPIAAAVASSPLRADSVVYVTGRAQEPFYLTELDGMIFAQDRKLPTLNGYSGNAPPGYLPPFPCTPPAARIHALAGFVFSGRGLTPEGVLSRTRWIALEQCSNRHVAIDAAAVPPDEEQARNIQLDATATVAGSGKLLVDLRIRNNGTATLHTVSRVGNPLRVTWRFVRAPASGDLARPAWEGRHDAYLSIPEGGEDRLAIVVPMPTEKGIYDLQFSIVAEGREWLHNLKMPIASTRVVVD